MNIIDLVDDPRYAADNCFVHQLGRCMQQLPGVRTASLATFASLPVPDLVVSRLRQRTLDRVRGDIRRWCGRTPVVVYDQDPWYALADDSPGKGTYERIAADLNVLTFAVTTEAWADLMRQQGLPTKFVRMGMLPEYCENVVRWEDRPVKLGFIGSVYPRRRQLFDRLGELGVNVNVRAGNVLPYPGYLRALSDIGIFIHNEGSQVIACGKVMDYADALWVKDLEAVARGCFSIRNSGHGSAAYYEGLKSALTFDSPDEVPGILARIDAMDPWERQAQLDADVEHLRQSNVWMATARTLVDH